MNRSPHWIIRTEIYSIYMIILQSTFEYVSCLAAALSASKSGGLMIRSEGSDLVA
ncbi:MAG: hypothetical protein HLUCCA11_18095 [Phormidesmis priestleyi Ana]|uniref:Uncharacterized protein n=1 Tax=Phormidesmis priestleyi Ana TaxID=1666911 RepID=A0A0P7ZTG5_9CYAN|nr:MAG: hypothetical protein HLUCCA11_18095 [Phormidesmis priestleyi Ana]